MDPFILDEEALAPEKNGWDKIFLKKWVECEPYECIPNGGVK
jgi:hypothetical protein